MMQATEETADANDIAVGEAGNEDALIGRIQAGDTRAYEIIMRKYNQRLYRIARSILKNESEAEDAVQDAYVRAYYNLKR
ncbi:MAG TPA: sigma factor, partial [Thiohalobacter sp.]|nr:sigma factor [Thiohalobacter sp.]